jgi:hypothetical protein
MRQQQQQTTIISKKLKSKEEGCQEMEQIMHEASLSPSIQDILDTMFSYHAVAQEGISVLHNVMLFGRFRTSGLMAICIEV